VDLHNIKRIQLAPGKFLVTQHRFIDTTIRPSDSLIKDNLNQLVAAGAMAIAVSESFGVDEGGKYIFSGLRKGSR